MYLLATTRPEPVVLAAGAYLVDGDTRLRCAFLVIQDGNKRRQVTLRDPVSKKRIRVRLPDEAFKKGDGGHQRFEKAVLEVLP